MAWRKKYKQAQEGYSKGNGKGMDTKAEAWGANSMICCWVDWLEDCDELGGES